MITLTFSVTPDHTAIGVRNAAQREKSLASGRDHLAPSTVACRGRECHPSADPSCSQTADRCRPMFPAIPCCPEGTDFARTRIAGRRRLPQVVAGCRRSRGRRHLHSMRRVHWKIQFASIKRFAPASHVLSSIVAPLTPAAQRLARDRDRFQDRFSRPEGWAYRAQGPRPKRCLGTARKQGRRLARPLRGLRQNQNLAPGQNRAENAGGSKTLTVSRNVHAG